MSFLSKIEKRLRIINFMARNDQKNIDQLFTRVFQSEDGQKILAYLHYTTSKRVLSSEATEAQFRHQEGQRALLNQIEKLADRGRHSSFI